MKLRYIASILAGLLTVIGLLGLFVEGDRSIPDWKTGEEVGLELKGVEISAELAKTEKERKIGLSDKDDLPEDEGLLLVFEERGYHGIWMRDMDFPIDIIWLDEEKEVIDFMENINPESYPEIFRPREPSLYVLETASGFIESTGLEKGDSAAVKK